MDGLPLFHFGAILADPPWYFANYSAKGEEKNPVAHYSCMDLSAIKALPVAHLARPDCALVMWATAPMLPHAFEVMAAWGFTFKTAGAWAKESKTGEKIAFGTGYIFRSAAEFYLVGTLGKASDQIEINPQPHMVSRARALPQTGSNACRCGNAF